MKPAHRQYDQSGLDRQFDIAAAVPRFDEHIAWFAAQSRLLRAASPRAALDVPYGVSAAETLDVFPADTPDPQPVQIFFHGGYWRRFSKDDFSFVAGTVNAAGGMAVVVDYALVPSVSLGTLVRQCLDAVAWVAQNIERYGGDPERIFVSGRSAGGTWRLSPAHTTGPRTVSPATWFEESWPSAGSTTSNRCDRATSTRCSVSLTPTWMSSVLPEDHQVGRPWFSPTAPRNRRVPTTSRRLPACSGRSGVDDGAHRARRGRPHDGGDRVGNLRQPDRADHAGTDAAPPRAV
ncbi:alpha/beta hydrolase [Pseudonocardia sp.]|uniref:alpha/beta hydrolase n=1 Tax=Pseudonocardia sp. TaxID=60912 RepID=UPI0029FA6DC1|nr:putative esterase [Pseudonocardia sp.]